MDKDKETQPVLLQELIDKNEKLLNEFKAVYKQDMHSLNKILSTYEDKLSSLETQIYELSFKIKHLYSELTREIPKEK